MDQREDLYALQKSRGINESSTLESIATAILEDWFDGENGEKILKNYAHPLYKALLHRTGREVNK